MRIDPLIEHYPIRVREVTIGVILTLTMLFYFFPKFLGESERTNFSIVEEIETFDVLDIPGQTNVAGINRLAYLSDAMLKGITNHNNE